ncbi:MAG: hypothetical protein WC683_05745 [bacterium]
MPSLVRSQTFGGGVARMNDSANPAMLDHTVFPVLRNVDPFYVGDIRKRNGRKRLSTSKLHPSDVASGSIGQITSVIPYDIYSGGTRYAGILLSDGKYIWSMTGSSGSPVQSAALHSTGTLASTWRGIGHGAFIYLVNGTDKNLMAYISAGALVIIQSGIEPPATTWTVAESNGTARYATDDVVYIRCAWSNPTTGVESNPSPVTAGADNIGTYKVTITAGNDDIDITIPAGTQTGVTTAIIYASRANSAAGEDPDLWYDGEKAESTTYSLADDGLGSDTAFTEIIWTDLDNARVERDLPPISPCIASYALRAWYGGAGADNAPYEGCPANWILFSDVDRPEYVAFTDQQTDHYDGTMIPQTSGDVQNFALAGDRLVVFTPEDTWTVIGDAPRFLLSHTGRGAGAIARDGVCSGDRFAYFLARDGVYVHSGTDQASLTHQILDTTYASLAATYLSSGLAVWYPTKQQAWFFVPSASSTVNDTVLVYQVSRDGKGGAWAIYDGYVVKAACCAKRVHENTYVPYIYVVDNQNIIYLCDSGTTDGAVDVGGTMSASTRSGTVTSGGATTCTDSTASFYATNDDLIGCPVWVTDATGGNAQLRWVTANTGTQLTVGAAWDSNPAAGWKYYVGGIGFRVVSAGVQMAGEGFHYVTPTGVAFHIDRNSYSGTDSMYCYILTDGATSIYSGDTKKTVALGDSSKLLDWPSVAFSANDHVEGGQIQVCLENYQTDRAIRVKRFVLNYRVDPTRLGGV